LKVKAGIFLLGYPSKRVEV